MLIKIKSLNLKISSHLINFKRKCSLKKFSLTGFGNFSFDVQKNNKKKL